MIKCFKKKEVLNSDKWMSKLFKLALNKEFD